MDFFQPSRITFWLVILLSSQPLFAQTNTFPTSGNVGIGVTNPRADLVVGSTFGALLSGSGGGRGLFGSNLAILSSGINVNSLYTPYTHSNNYGYSGIMSSWGKLYFYASEGNTTQDQIVTPVVRMFINTNGNIGIGTSTPSYKLHVDGDMYSYLNNTSAIPQFTIEKDGTGDAAMRFVLTGGTSWSMGVDNSLGDFFGISPVNYGIDSSAPFAISTTGNVGIGTTTPGNKLEVNGKVRSKEVIVEATGWPDYVFEADYDLPTLAEIEAFIKANKHLPDVPSAEQVEEQGQHIGEIQKQLLKKMEEMTLYMIELKKENELLKKEKEVNNAQQERIDQLIKRIEQLESKN